jgi:outer membrane protein OmpA-like peptidoglycan-associated protein
MPSRNALLAATLLTAVSVPALAQNPSPKGFYVGGALGANMQNESTYSGQGINNDSEQKIGPMGALSLGYGYGNGLRTEIEAAARANGVDKVGGTGGSGGEGDIRAYSAMLNLLYDIGTGTAFTPYLGLGAGWAFLDAGGVRSLNGNRTVNGSDNKFAYQGIAGVAYGLSDQLKLTLDYRYFATLDPKYSAKTQAGASTSVDSEYSAHSLLLGLRYHFAAPAPVPVAVPQAAPPAAPKADIQRSFLVFFDFNKSDVTAEANRVIAQAADHAKRGGVSRIVVTGHTDTSGSPQYNQRLSERRAANVREALVRQGLAANAISTVGKGESDPLVRTADGVREPQNRRAEIVLQ